MKLTIFAKKMEYELCKIDAMCGDKASIYSVRINNEDETLFEKFINENLTLHRSEIMDILDRLERIAKNTGAKENYFKLNEGTWGDGVCALYDNPHKNIRLYCIRYDNRLIVLGGGGEKDKKIRALQESSKLKKENYLLRKISKLITKQIKDHELLLESDRFNGNMKFED